MMSLYTIEINEEAKKHAYPYVTEIVEKEF